MATAELALVISARNQAQGALRQLKSDITSAGSAAQRAAEQMKSIGSTLTSLGTRATVGISTPILAFAGAAVKAASNMEQLDIAFTTMLGSAEEAKNLMADLIRFSAETPFEMPEVVAAGKQLLAFGIAAQDIEPTLQQLGDVASGVGSSIGDLAYLFGTASASGRLMTIDINQFAMRGIPIIESLAEVMGVATTEVRNMAAEGQISADLMKQAFELMTAEGSKFGGMMEQQSQTVSGLFSTLKDNVTQTLTTIGQVIIDTFDLRAKLADGIAFLGEIRDAVQSFAAINPELFQLSVTFAAVAAAIGPVTVGLGLAVGAIGNLIPVVGVLGGALGALVSPLGLVAAGLALLVAYDVGGLRTGIVELAGSVMAFGQSAVDALPQVQGFFAALAQSGANSTQVLSAIEALPGPFRRTAEMVRTSIAALGDAFGPSLARLRESFTAMLSGLSELEPEITALSVSVAAAFTAMTPAIEAFGAVAGTVLAIGVPIAINTFASVFQALPATISIAIDQITAVINLIATTVEGMTTIVTSLMEGDFVGAWQGAKDIVAGFGEFIDTTMSNAVELIGISFGTLRDTVTNSLTDIARMLGAEGLLGGIQFVDQAIDSFITKLAGLSTGEMFNIPAWVDDLMAWVWPEFTPLPGWVTTLIAWSWPAFILLPVWVSRLVAWVWPALPSAPGWITSLLSWDWPAMPGPPAWVTQLFGGNDGGDTGAAAPANNAVGTRNWRGGLTWVGETGPELVAPPRGSRIFSPNESAMLAGGGVHEVINSMLQAFTIVASEFRAVGYDWVDKSQQVIKGLGDNTGSLNLLTDAQITAAQVSQSALARNSSALVDTGELIRSSARGFADAVDRSSELLANRADSGNLSISPAPIPAGGFPQATGGIFSQSAKAETVNVTVNVANVSSDVDIEAMAYRVAREIQRRR